MRRGRDQPLKAGPDGEFWPIICIFAYAYVSILGNLGSSAQQNNKSFLIRCTFLFKDCPYIITLNNWHFSLSSNWFSWHFPDISNCLHQLLSVTSRQPCKIEFFQKSFLKVYKLITHFLRNRIILHPSSFDDKIYTSTFFCNLLHLFSVKTDWNMRPAA